MHTHANEVREVKLDNASNKRKSIENKIVQNYVNKRIIVRQVLVQSLVHVIKI